MFLKEFFKFNFEKSLTVNDNKSLKNYTICKELNRKKLASLSVGLYFATFVGSLTLLLGCTPNAHPTILVVSSCNKIFPTLANSFH